MPLHKQLVVQQSRKDLSPLRAINRAKTRPCLIDPLSLNIASACAYGSRRTHGARSQETNGESWGGSVPKTLILAKASSSPATDEGERHDNDRFAPQAQTVTPAAWRFFLLTAGTAWKAVPIPTRGTLS